MTQQRIIGLTGGIGCGKSVVLNIAHCMGVEVYDCDSRAKLIMDTDPEIKQAIAQTICENAIVNGMIDRAILGAHIFSCEEARLKLNTLVHGAVKADFEKWCADKKMALIESAILFSSGLSECVTEVWEVIAPLELRIERIQLRNPNLSYSEILSRIESQKNESDHPMKDSTKLIVNDGFTPLLPRVESLLSMDPFANSPFDKSN